MLNPRTAVIGLAGGMISVAGLWFFFENGATDLALVEYGALLATGAILLIASAFMKGPVEPEELRRGAYCSLSIGLIVFVASAYQSWDPAELLILVSNGAYSAVLLIWRARAL